MDEVTANMAELTGRVTALAPLARVIGASAGSPVAKVAALAYGVNRALWIRWSAGRAGRGSGGGGAGPADAGGAPRRPGAWTAGGATRWRHDQAAVLAHAGRRPRGGRLPAAHRARPLGHALGAGQGVRPVHRRRARGHAAL